MRVNKELSLGTNTAWLLRPSKCWGCFQPYLSGWKKKYPVEIPPWTECFSCSSMTAAPCFPLARGTVLQPQVPCTPGALHASTTIPTSPPALHEQLNVCFSSPSILHPNSSSCTSPSPVLCREQLLGRLQQH